jgi:predicted DNA-binding protein YlxM (UPF0122 family)
MPKKKSNKLQKKSTETTKSKGLGDTVEKVLQKTGIDKVAKWVLGEDCGCEERKNKLNYLFPYYKPECLTEEEFEYLDKYYKENKSTVSPQTQVELLTIYNRIFHQNRKTTSCSSCFKKELHNKLHRVYREYLED